VIHWFRIRRPWLRIPPLALAALVLVPAAMASPVRIVGIDTGGYPNMRVTVVAPPGGPAPYARENGLPVTGLEAVNLGKAKSVVLCVDHSQSMTGASLRNALAGARAFVKAKAPGDRIEVIEFGKQAFALTRFSSSATDADVALARMAPDPQSGTALWDAVAMASRHLAKESQPGHVIIVLTDGQDVSSRATFAQAVAAAHVARASVYTIGISGRNFTPDPLRQLAAHTGGTYHEASTSTQLASIYSSISSTLSHSWELRYPTVARPGDSIKIAAIVNGVGHADESVRLAGLGASGVIAPNGVLPASAWASSVAPVVVALIVGFLILLACFFVYSARYGLWVRARLAPHLGQQTHAAKSRRKRSRGTLLRRVTGATEHAFANVRHFRSLQRLIERADLPLRASELLYISLGCGLFLGLFGAVVIASPLPIIILMAIGLSLPFGFVKFKASNRLKAFDNQLPDVLITISSSLKAGHSFRAALQGVVDEGAQPTAKEFSRVLSETQLGRPIDEAMTEMADRAGSKNLSFVMTAVSIQRQVGGSLAGLFDMVAETVRQRQQFARKVRGLTAMGRMSSYVLIALPLFIAVAITAMNPAYMSPLYHTSSGHLLILIGSVMMVVGSFILKKMVAFKG
jgi:tight adherence protein B